jgi:hypothetical protein
MGATYGEWREIYIDVDILKMHGYREGAARRLGLPEDTTWDDIYRFTDEQDRRHLARRYGLPDTASMDDIRPYLEQDESLISKGSKRYNLDQEDLREAAASALHLPKHFSDWRHIFERAVLVGVESPEDVINRLREIELHYLDKIAKGERHTFSSPK